MNLILYLNRLQLSGMLLILAGTIGLIDRVIGSGPHVMDSAYVYVLVFSMGLMNVGQAKSAHR